MAEEFSLEIVPVDAENTIVLKPRGSIDSESTPAIERRLAAAMGNRQHQIVLDLSEAEFVSSAGLGLMLGTVATLRERGGDLILMNVSVEVADTLQLMDVEDYFRVITNIDELTGANA